MRAFSLIEMMTGLMVAMVLIIGFISYSQQVTNQCLSWRRQQEAHTSLLTAQASLRQLVSMDEPEFWRHFPLEIQPIHAVDHSHHGFQTTQTCPNREQGGCFIFWDLGPHPQSPVLYKLVAHDFPNWVQPTPIEGDLPMGPGDDIGSGTIVLIQSAEQIIPIIVSEVSGDQVSLHPLADQPWPIPESIPLENATMVVLGQLQVHHISLFPSANRHFTLHYQPWLLQEGGWRSKRGRTGDTLLVDLAIGFCSANHPDRITLVTQPREPNPIPMPLTIGPTTYHEEVFHATIAF